MNATQYPGARRVAHLIFAICLALGAAVAARADINWTLRHDGTAGTSLLWGITEGNAGIVAVGNDGTILHSLDGQTWTAENSGTRVWLVAVTYGNGRYVAVGDNGTILTSTDAITWTAATKTGTTARLNNVVYGQGKYVAVGEAGTIIVSTDGTSWSQTESGTTAWLHGLAFANGTWVATGEKGTIVGSGDGIKWFKCLYNVTQANLESVVFSETFPGNPPTNCFLAVGSGGASYAITVSTPDGGATYSLFAYDPFMFSGTGTTVRLSCIATYHQLYVITGDNGTVLTGPSRFGPWTPSKIGTNKLLNASGFAQGSLFLVGEGGVIYQSDPVFESRLGNISTRGVSSGGDNVLIAGTIITGTKAKKLLIRGVGPKLTSYGVGGVLSDPILKVYDEKQKLIAENAGWGKNLSPSSITDAIKAAGTFDFDSGSHDAAMVVTLNPGAYTFVLGSESNERSGVAMVEAYDLDPVDAESSRPINISSRGVVGVDENILIAGIIIKGPSARTILIRGIGPTLDQYHVPGYLADPVVTVFQNSTPIATNDDWGTKTTVYGRDVTADDIRAATRASGAFPLADESKDAALLMTLVPGAYTIQVTGKNRTTGIALVEAYEVPTN
ncbi:hypothetical protein DB347_21050 [Opitutaceae bacterium EW11]|nr:hypothetical protein DB347_21050 [Opitutaceae bacterium EW11]